MYFKAINRFHSMFVNFFIGCLKFHRFIFAMPIVQGIVFLYLDMYICKHFLFVLHLPTYTQIAKIFGGFEQISSFHLLKSSHFANRI